MVCSLLPPILCAVAVATVATGRYTILRQGAA